MLSDLQKRKFTMIFKSLDANGDGKVDRQDSLRILNNIRKELGQAGDLPEFQVVRESFNKPWDMLLQKGKSAQGLDEWLAHHDALVSNPEQFKQEYLRIAETLFSLQDRDRDGRLSVDEMRAHYRCYGITDPKIHEWIFERIDLDRDGYLSKEELFTVMQQFYLSNDPADPGNYTWGPF